MNIQIPTKVPDYVIRDLQASGLRPEDVNARAIDNAERAATVTPYSVTGYVLPYFDLSGRILPFYRVKLFDSDAKYRQPKDSPNHVYFPKQFGNVLEGKNYVFFTEGEKKAAAICKAGFPAVGFGGVDSWRNRTILIPGDANIAQKNNKLAVKLTADGEATENLTSPLATGFVELIDLVVAKKLNVIICYDTDNDTGNVSNEVQRAAATLGYELRFRGVSFNRIRQMVLPQIKSFDFTGDKVGLDDFLVSQGKGRLTELLGQCLDARSAFPQHPNVRDYINRRLSRTQLPRKEFQNVAMAVLSDLDSHGQRLRGITNDTYYFDHRSKQLIRAEWPKANNGAFDSPFTQYLYREYGLSGADARLLMWLGTQFSSEEPIDKVTPYRIFARPQTEADEVIYQLSDTNYVKVTADGIKFYDNGANSILFESDQVEPLSVEEVQAAYNKLRDAPLGCWWAGTLAQVRLRDKDKQRIVAALLYYMSPWLFRWRGMQLPIELIVGESGSGKSTLCEMRLDVLTGRPILRNSPTDLKDWYASIVNAGGLHVTDNVKLGDPALRQRLSDEICRIVTEPDPFIEQRKYYTNADLVRIPVRVVFAVTSIQQPFQNADIIQRSFILELDKSLDANSEGLIRYDSKWESNQINNKGGRAYWVAHHLLVLEKFFKAARESWDPDYMAKSRLINFEQAMVAMAKVFGIPATWVPDFLSTTTDQQVGEADWILEGLHAFASEHFIPEFVGKKFRAGTIAEWAKEQEEYCKCEMLVNVRKLGKYLSSHKAAVFTLTGIRENGIEQNRTVYKLERKPLRRRASG